MNLSITVSGYNRPFYLERTLKALRQCDGIDQCQVLVVLDAAPEQEQQAYIARDLDFHSLKLAIRHGCNQTILTSFVEGFTRFGKDFHVHLEDDTVPCRDALRWFAWARDRFRDEPDVMNVSGYQRVSNGTSTGYASRRWFTPWGWGVWRDRFMGLLRGWSTHDEARQGVSWDTVVNHALRAGRREVFPTVSRIQNIGAELGEHVPSAEWHAANHHVPETADDLPAFDPVTSWMFTGSHDRADHA